MSYIISCSSQRSIKSIQSNKLLRKLHLILMREWTRLIRRNNINQILPPIQLLQMLHLKVLIWKWFGLCFIFFSVQKCKKRKYFWHVPRWNYLSLLHVERYILIWNFLHCQYLIYETTKCYLRFWKISSEIGPFFKR